MDKELFDKMLHAAILKDRINYVAGLMSELEMQTSFYIGTDIGKYRRSICQELHEQLNSLGVEPLTYETLLKEEIQSAQSRAILMSGNDYDWNSIWEQRRYEIAKDMLAAIYTNEGKTNADIAILEADTLIKKLKKNKQ